MATASEPLLPSAMGAVTADDDRGGGGGGLLPSSLAPPRPPRQWDGPLLACCGRDPCDPADCGVCGVVACMPCGMAVLHG